MSKERELLERIEEEDYVEMLPSELWLDGYEAGKRSALLSKQPEQHGTQYLLDQVSMLRAENAMLKEKWSTQKREPLSDKDIGKGFLLTDVWHRYECFIAGVKYAENHHSIGGGE